jgi:Ca2+-binding RTX toxin-like protein
MQGGTNSDQMRGDGGNDVLLGEAGNDLLKGGEGDDEMYGGGDADLVCDFVGDLVCATDQAQILNGGAGNDTIFYENDVGGVCEDRRIDPTSTADGGNDTCGDTDDWAANELPLSCDNGTGALPVGCQ